MYCFTSLSKEFYLYDAIFQEAIKQSEKNCNGNHIFVKRDKNYKGIFKLIIRRQTDRQHHGEKQKTSTIYIPQHNKQKTEQHKTVGDLR